MKQKYSPSEAAKILGVTVNALKQRAILVEKDGFKISRNEKGHRIYTKEDFSVLYPNKKVEKINTKNFNNPLPNKTAHETIRISKEALEYDMFVIEETIKKLEEEIARKQAEVERYIIKREKTADMLKSIEVYLG